MIARTRDRYAERSTATRWPQYAAPWAERLLVIVGTAMLVWCAALVVDAITAQTRTQRVRDSPGRPAFQRAGGLTAARWRNAMAPLNFDTEADAIYVDAASKDDL